jgi:hypothetical protein
LRLLDIHIKQPRPKPQLPSEYLSNQLGVT